MSRTRPRGGFEPEIEKQFRDSRISSLAAVNANTFWSIAIIVLAFGLWDFFVDPVNWRAAFRARLAAAAVIVATGMFQKIPGRSRWMPFMAKIRLVTAVVASAIAATMLDQGYGFGVAGIAAILLTGPYIAIDTRDLFVINVAVLIALGAVTPLVSIDAFNATGTIVFVLLAVVVSSLLGRVLETTHRRAFQLDLELRRDARTDALTGLDNRRAMQERGPVELKRADRSGAPVSMILCDIDHFKRINDRFGHETGDNVLRTIARVLRAALRETDALGRWGGEEFMAVLVDTDAKLACDIAERMRIAVAASPFEGLREQVTVSLGVSTLQDFDSIAAAWEDLIKEADRNLYRAKSEGRNRVIGSLQP